MGRERCRVLRSVLEDMTRLRISSVRLAWYLTLLVPGVLVSCHTRPPAGRPLDGGVRAVDVRPPQSRDLAAVMVSLELRATETPRQRYGSICRHVRPVTPGTSRAQAMRGCILIMWMNAAGSSYCEKMLGYPNNFPVDSHGPRERAFDRCLKSLSFRGKPAGLGLGW